MFFGIKRSFRSETFQFTILSLKVCDVLFEFPDSFVEFFLLFVCLTKILDNFLCVFWVATENLSKPYFTLGQPGRVYGSSVVCIVTCVTDNQALSCCPKKRMSTWWLNITSNKFKNRQLKQNSPGNILYYFSATIPTMKHLNKRYIKCSESNSFDYKCRFLYSQWTYVINQSPS